LPDDLSASGRQADRPTDIPPNGWKDILRRSFREISENNIFLISGGVTYAIVLALFPGLAALVSIYGLLLAPSQVEEHVNALSGVLPDQSRQILGTELHQLASASSGALGTGAIIGLLLALWSASRAMSGLMSAMDIAYEQKETRSFLKFNLTALLLTLGAIVSGLVAIALIAVLPAVAPHLDAGGLSRALTLVQWPVLIVLVMIGLAVLYRYAPDRDEPQWRWVSPGAIAATTLWILGSIVFTVYVVNFGSYDKTYGSLGGVVVLLTWLYLSSFTVLLGAVINAQSERQARHDNRRQ
jgi:membrane protein